MKSTGKFNKITGEEIFQVEGMITIEGKYHKYVILDNKVTIDGMFIEDFVLSLPPEVRETIKH